MPSLSWLGEDIPYLDQPHIATCGSIILGCYGGSTKVGATKNEDAAWLLCPNDSSWELAVLLDAHTTSQSAALIVRWCEQAQPQLEQICRRPPASSIDDLSQFLLRSFSSQSFRETARTVRGETACLIVFRTTQWLFWFSVGDCVVYLFHPDLMRLGQYALNQRQFYEWIGQVNTFDRAIPCFSSGTRELRDGLHTIVMLTDGVLECGTHPFENPARLAQFLAPISPETDFGHSVSSVLEQVMIENGRDSATIIAWRCNNSGNFATQPSQ
jgi:hypothetical protein